MNAPSVRPASICGGTPTAGAAPVAAPPRRRHADADYYNNCVTSRRPSQCYSELSGSSRHTAAAAHHGAGAVAGAYDAKQQQQQWTSYRTDVTGTSIRTPISSGKFRTNFSFRQAQVPDGYPKMDHERNPRRESFVAEFSRKLAEGYDIWEDEDRPVINWVFPRLPIRKNKTHELRMMANRERITKMLEREKQMNKRNGGRMMQGGAAAADKRETAWWERSRNGVSRTPAAHAGGHAAVPGTPRASAGGHHHQHSGANHRGWSSNVSARQTFAAAPKGGSYYGGGGSRR